MHSRVESPPWLPSRATNRWLGEVNLQTYVTALERYHSLSHKLTNRMSVPTVIVSRAWLSLSNKFSLDNWWVSLKSVFAVSLEHYKLYITEYQTVHRTPIGTQIASKFSQKPCFKSRYRLDSNNLEFIVQIVQYNRTSSRLHIVPMICTKYNIHGHTNSKETMTTFSTYPDIN